VIGNLNPFFEFRAITAALEQKEDDPHAGAEDLKQIEKKCKNILLIGITCGLSAPYVAGNSSLFNQSF
jgi:N-acetylmuramic acid 6-phosphate (MurNAc-6-P) etherase